MDRLLRLPDDARSPDRVEREIQRLERRVNKLVKLTDQEAEWLLEDRLKSRGPDATGETLGEPAYRLATWNVAAIIHHID